MSGSPFFSIVIPVRNGGRFLERCLEAVAHSSFEDYETIVVDDGSSDASAETAARAGASVLASPARGPAAARNRGAREARGVFVFFLDADCLLEPRALERAASILRSDPSVDALFGSYDDAPEASGLAAQFKNLQHHYVHQNGREESATFWAGCGAVRRDLFEALGGFDEQRFHRPTVEDIELGHRLAAAGHRIRLAKEVTVKHLKAWTFRGVVASDLLDRGIPWARLCREKGASGDELNLSSLEKVKAAIAVAVPACLLITPWWPRAGVVVGTVALGAFVLLNLPFYRFLFERRGLGFAVASLALHAVYYWNCALAYVLGGLLHLFRGPGTPLARARD